LGLAKSENEINLQMPTKIPARLYCLLAREARIGVIFRRGPSRQVLLIRWNMAKDSFEEGQWFKGRIYERRCDLSPYGDKLIYFAATYKAPLHSWTAISKPPWFTAVALWSKGDGWNGGGYFVTQNSVVLNDPWRDMVLQSTSDMRGIKVVGHVEQKGEDAPTHHLLLERSGWKFKQQAVWQPHSFNQGWIADSPEIWSKALPSKALSLQMECHGIARRNQGWYDMRYRIQDSKQNIILDLGKTDWAEWDSNSDLIFARGGCLYRAKTKRNRVAEPIMLADFNNHTFKAIPSPTSAKSW
jgi:hypothetical protein